MTNVPYTRQCRTPRTILNLEKTCCVGDMLCHGHGSFLNRNVITEIT